MGLDRFTGIEWERTLQMGGRDCIDTSELGVARSDQTVFK